MIRLLGFAHDIKCWVCPGEGGLCKDSEEKGKETECGEKHEACMSGYMSMLSAKFTRGLQAIVVVLVASCLVSGLMIKRLSCFLAKDGATAYFRDCLPINIEITGCLDVTEDGVIMILIVQCDP